MGLNILQSWLRAGLIPGDASAHKNNFQHGSSPYAIAIKSPFRMLLYVTVLLLSCLACTFAVADQNVIPRMFQAELHHSQPNTFTKVGAKFRLRTVVIPIVTVAHTSPHVRTSTTHVNAWSDRPICQPIKRGLPNGWAFQGCVVDTVNPRSLSWYAGDDVPAKNMSGTLCVQYCDQKGYSLAGTEYASECFCGDELVGSSTAESATCFMPCNGTPDEQCGGPARLSLYSKNGNIKSSNTTLGIPANPTSVSTSGSTTVESPTLVSFANTTSFTSNARTIIIGAGDALTSSQVNGSGVATSSCTVTKTVAIAGLCQFVRF